MKSEGSYSEGRDAVTITPSVWAGPGHFYMTNHSRVSHHTGRVTQKCVRGDLPEVGILEHSP